MIPSVEMPRHRYLLRIGVTDERPGWSFWNRVVPRGFTITLEKLIRVADDRSWTDLSDAEYDEVVETEVTRGADWMIGSRTWVVLEVESSPTIPPRCVVLRAPAGVSPAEQRLPITNMVMDAAARIASKDGTFTFTDLPQGYEYEDVRSEIRRGRRKRARQAITSERLEAVAEIARQNPRTPTAAVVRHFGFSRGYARKLIKLADPPG